MKFVDTPSAGAVCAKCGAPKSDHDKRCSKLVLACMKEFERRYPLNLFVLELQDARRRGEQLELWR